MGDGTVQQLSASEQRRERKVTRSKILLSHTVLRAISFLASLTTIIIAIYGSSRYKASAQFLGAYVAGFWTMFLDGVVMGTLLLVACRKSLLHPGLLATVDVLTVILCTAAPVVVAWFIRSYESSCEVSGPRCHELDRHTHRTDVPLLGALVSQWIVGGFHLAFTGLACIRQCSGR